MRPFFYIKFFFERVRRYEFEVNRYYHNSLFKALDLRLKSRYSFRSPFDIGRSYQKLNPEKSNLYLYGETPLKIYEEMAERWSVAQSSTFLELGSGIGRGLFFLSSFFHCKCIGIEWIAEFVQEAKKIAQFNRLKDVYFMCGDLFNLQYPKVDFVYLFGTCLKTAEIESLCDIFFRDMPNAKIITVSYPLSFYNKNFHTLDEFQGDFEFGKTTLYLNSRSKMLNLK